MSLIQAENLTKVYGSGDTAVTALDHVNLSVEAGEFVAVMGPSGCGKSTLLHLLGGLDRPSEGRVLIDGQPINELGDDDLTKLRRRKIGFVFQFYNLIPVLDAIENAALPVTLDGGSPAKAMAKARDWLEKVGLGNRLKNRPDQLSGGQQQRVAWRAPWWPSRPWCWRTSRRATWIRTLRTRSPLCCARWRTSGAGRW